ncbi:MAG: Patatin [Candidatus Solibacter sp.]|nr:Patatin [Candidatus Solibacter sp.]
MINALVLSAGGLWAAWEVGVWKVLRERFRPDLIVGASAGSWNGWAIAAGCTPEELESEWLDPRMAGLMQFGLHSTGFLRAAPIHEKARELFARFRPRTPFALTMVELPSLRSRIVRECEITPLHLAASAAIPFGFPPVKIDGHYYIDGGFRAGLPLWAAEELGATRAVALNVLNTVEFRVLGRIMWKKRASGTMPVTLLEPSERLGSLHDAMHWNSTNIRNWIALGERDANRIASSITM